jgi:hypothetical protein
MMGSPFYGHGTADEHGHGTADEHGHGTAGGGG